MSRYDFPVLVGVTEWAGQIRLQHVIIVYSEFGRRAP